MFMETSGLNSLEELGRVLVSMADAGRVPHAMLFYENEGCGALPLVLDFCRYLNCRSPRNGKPCGECPSCRQMDKLEHPDIHFVFPVNTSSRLSSSEKPLSAALLKWWRELVLSNPYFLENELYQAIGIEGKAAAIAVAEAKYIMEKLSLSSFQNGYKAVVLWLPEKMNADTANRLLKIVEEPPEKTLFLFITHSPEKVLQTIFSRCQIFRVPPASKEEVARVLEERFNVTKDQARIQAALSGGSTGVALSLLGDREDYSKNMDLLADLLNGALERDLSRTLEAAENIASLPSREKLKGFCIFAGDCVRKIYMIREGMSSISNAAEQELPFLTGIARGCGDAFCPKALGYFDKAASLIERNVNQKIVFCDLADRIFLSIK